MPGDREVVERVAEDEVVLVRVLMQLDELAGVAPVSLDLILLGKAGGLEVRIGDGRVDLGDVDAGPGIGALHVPLEAIGAAAEEQGLEVRRLPAGIYGSGRSSWKTMLLSFARSSSRSFLA